MKLNMRKYTLSQEEVDKLVVVERRIVKPTIYGFGINDVAFKSGSMKSGKKIWQYDLWRTMLKRCFCPKYKVHRPTYADVTVCEEWLYFGSFLEWVNKEVDYKGKPEGMCLDKDIILRGNKVYSPDTCCFVPQAVNLLITDCAKSRGKWPLGVTLDKPSKKFTATIRRHGIASHLGLYETPEQAFLVYKAAKEDWIKQMALQNKSLLKQSAFDSLINWVV